MAIPHGPEPMRYSVEVTTRFEALHHWRDQPLGYDKRVLPHTEQVSGLLTSEPFLKFPHRHVFHVRVRVAVTDTDRGVEFLQLKQRVDAICAQWHKSEEVWPFSCEQFAALIFAQLNSAALPVRMVSVAEDGENAGIVETRF